MLTIRLSRQSKPKWRSLVGAYSLTLRDHGREVSTVRFRGVDLSAGNIVAQSGLIADLEAAIDAVTLGAIAKSTMIANEIVGTADPASSPFAQREQKWLVVASDDVTGFPVRFEIPTADLDQLTANGEELAAGTNRTALISAIEAYAKSNAGNAVTVQRILYVSRNL